MWLVGGELWLEVRVEAVVEGVKVEVVVGGGGGGGSCGGGWWKWWRELWWRLWLEVMGVVLEAVLGPQPRIGEDRSAL